MKEKATINHKTGVAEKVNEFHMCYPKISVILQGLILILVQQIPDHSISIGLLI